MHPGRQFLGHFGLHMHSFLHFLLRVTRPLCSLRGARESSLLGMSSWGCEDTDTRRRLLFKEVGVYFGFQLQL